MQLNENEKRLVIDRLACMVLPSEIIAELKQDYGKTTTAAQIVYYNPTCVQGTALPKKWRDLFFERRARFISETESIPLSIRNYRLQLLQDQLETPQTRKNPRLVMDIVVTAEKICGDVFTNKRDVTSDGKSLFDGVSDADLIARAKGALGGVVSPGTDPDSAD